MGMMSGDNISLPGDTVWDNIFVGMMFGDSTSLPGDTVWDNIFVETMSKTTSFACE